MKKKIVIHDFAIHPFALQLSKELSKNGFEIFHLFFQSFLSPNNININYAESDSLDFHLESINISKYNKYNFLKRKKYEILYGNLVCKKLDIIKPDIVILCTTPLDPTKIILKYCKKRNIKFIFWLQDIYSIAIKNILSKKIPFIGSFIGDYYSHLEKRILRESDHIIAIAADFLPFLTSSQVSLDKVSVLNNWAPINEIPALSKTNSWSIENKLTESFNFLYSGTIGFKHNPNILIKLAQYFKEEKNIRIIIVSEGLAVEWLKIKVHDFNLSNIVFYNFQPFDKLPLILAAADVLVALLEKDAGIYSVPSKVLTYLCAGRPLLLSVPKQNLAANIVEKNSAGLVSEPNDDESFLNNAKELYNNKKLRELFSDNARNYAELNSDIERITSWFINLFEKYI